MSTLLDAVAGDAITLARCWILVRKDGEIRGFTDHDEPITLDGTLCLAATGLDAAEADSSLGLSVDDAEIVGALTTDAIREDELLSGAYDGAEVRLFVVDWTAPELHSWTATYIVGEIVRADGAFRAELRGLSELLEAPTARRFTRDCDARFGDARCGIDLRMGLTEKATVVASGPRAVTVPAVGGALLARLAGGRVTWRTATGARRTARIAVATAVNGGVAIEFARRVDEPPEIGAGAELVAGCDKTFATCRDVYANAANFRGFPYLPDGDFAFSYASADGGHDGRPVVP